MTMAFDRKVIVLTDFQGYGGTKSYFFNLLKYLSAKNVRLHVVLRSDASLSPEELDGMSAYGVEKISTWPWYLHIPVFKKLKLNGVAGGFFLLVLKMRDDYENIIISTGTPGLFLSSSIVWGGNALYILHTYPHGNVSRISEIANIIRAYFIKQGLNRGFRILTVSRYAKKAIESSWLGGESHENVRFIYNTARKSCANEASVISQQVSRVVTLGHVEWYKNPDFWLKVALEVSSQAPHVEFIWGGAGSMLDQLRQKIPANLKESVRFIGRVDEPASVLPGACIYFQPSIIESHGMAVIEAMSYQIPCIVSDRGGLPESVEHGVTGYVVNINDTKEASNRILYLINNSQEAERMGVNGYKNYAVKFSYISWEREMTCLLNEENN